MKDWLLAIDWKRVARTFVQVFGGVLIAFLLDYGMDGAVVVKDYIYGDKGIIVVGTTAIALYMNRPTAKMP